MTLSDGSHRTTLVPIENMGDYPAIWFANASNDATASQMVQQVWSLQDVNFANHQASPFNLPSTDTMTRNSNALLAQNSVAEFASIQSPPSILNIQLAANSVIQLQNSSSSQPIFLSVMSNVCESASHATTSAPESTTLPMPLPYQVTNASMTHLANVSAMPQPSSSMMQPIGVAMTQLPSVSAMPQQSASMVQPVGVGMIQLPNALVMPQQSASMVQPVGVGMTKLPSILTMPQFSAKMVQPIGVVETHLPSVSAMSQQSAPLVEPIYVIEKQRHSVSAVPRPNVYIVQPKNVATKQHPSVPAMVQPRAPMVRPRAPMVRQRALMVRPRAPMLQPKGVTMIQHPSVPAMVRPSTSTTQQIGVTTPQRPSVPAMPRLSASIVQPIGVATAQLSKNIMSEPSASLEVLQQQLPNKGPELSYTKAGSGSKTYYYVHRVGVGQHNYQKTRNTPHPLQALIARNPDTKEFRIQTKNISSGPQKSALSRSSVPPPAKNDCANSIPVRVMKQVKETTRPNIIRRTLLTPRPESQATTCSEATCIRPGTDLTFATSILNSQSQCATSSLVSTTCSSEKLTESIFKSGVSNQQVLVQLKGGLALLQNNDTLQPNDSGVTLLSSAHAPAARPVNEQSNPILNRCKVPAPSTLHAPITVHEKMPVKMGNKNYSRQSCQKVYVLKKMTKPSAWVPVTSQAVVKGKSQECHAENLTRGMDPAKLDSRGKVATEESRESSSIIRAQSKLTLYEAVEEHVAEDFRSAVSASNHKLNQEQSAKLSLLTKQIIEVQMPNILPVMQIVEEQMSNNLQPLIESQEAVKLDAETAPKTATENQRNYQMSDDKFPVEQPREKLKRFGEIRNFDEDEDLDFLLSLIPEMHFSDKCEQDFSESEQTNLQQLEITTKQYLDDDWMPQVGLSPGIQENSTEVLGPELASPGLKEKAKILLEKDGVFRSQVNIMPCPDQSSPNDNAIGSLELFEKETEIFNKNSVGMPKIGISPCPIKRLSDVQNTPEGYKMRKKLFKTGGMKPIQLGCSPCPVENFAKELSVSKNARLDSRECLTISSEKDDVKWPRVGFSPCPEDSSTNDPARQILKFDGNEEFSLPKDFMPQCLTENYSYSFPILKATHATMLPKEMMDGPVQNPGITDHSLLIEKENAPKKRKNDYAQNNGFSKSATILEKKSSLKRMKYNTAHDPRITDPKLLGTCQVMLEKMTPFYSTKRTVHLKSISTNALFLSTCHLPKVKKGKRRRKTITSQVVTSHHQSLSSEHLGLLPVSTKDVGETSASVSSNLTATSHLPKVKRKKQVTWQLDTSPRQSPKSKHLCLLPVSTKDVKETSASASSNLTTTCHLPKIKKKKKVTWQLNTSPRQSPRSKHLGLLPISTKDVTETSASASSNLTTTCHLPKIKRKKKATWQVDTSPRLSPRWKHTGRFISTKDIVKTRASSMCNLKTTRSSPTEKVQMPNRLSNRRNIFKKPKLPKSLIKVEEVSMEESQPVLPEAVTGAMHQSDHKMSIRSETDARIQLLQKQLKIQLAGLDPISPPIVP